MSTVRRPSPLRIGLRLVLAFAIAIVACAIIIGNMANQPVRGLYTQIEINAPPERVWQVLTDFAAYPQWNPFLRVRGKPEEGRRLSVTVQPSGTHGMIFWPKVTVVLPNQQLTWLGHLFFIPGLFDGEHSFELEPLPGGGTRFIQRERFHGSLVNAFWDYITTETGRGFREMNQALKARCERH